MRKEVLYLYKITLGIEGMACGMCESHVNDAVRKAFAVKKVSSWHGKKRTEILAEQPSVVEERRAASGQTGYSVTSYACEPYEKKSFSLFKRKG